MIRQFNPATGVDGPMGPETDKKIKEVKEAIMDSKAGAEPTSSNEYDDADEAREVYIRRMVDEGYAVVLPAPNEVQVDIDTEEQFEHFRRQYDSLLKEYPSVSVNISASRNGYPGRHVTITMPFDMSDVERIAWQAALGSDPFRELMSLFRLRRGDSHPTLFVEKEGRIRRMFMMNKEEKGKYTCSNCEGCAICGAFGDSPENCEEFHLLEPKQIFHMEKTVQILKTPMVKNGDGVYEDNYDDAELTYDRVVREWFEDENGVELIMEEGL